ncbi:hypothetical protein AVEN_30676-1 [Araneus ventricosus]|uniref:Uncharacterized protein n=1 Tax=Araneus ventricosus TaxID=182803 RepID=A0A4Y2IWX5_ARAVE|nr:hypothetical protein AVEN_30676-1 [Araneus ventricosus]
MQRLPVQIQQILSVSGDNLQALSKMADNIFVISKGDLVASVSANFQSSYVSKFENRLAAIENRLSRLEVRRRSLSRGNTDVRGSCCVNSFSVSVARCAVISDVRCFRPCFRFCPKSGRKW